MKTLYSVLALLLVAAMLLSLGALAADATDTYVTVSTDEHGYERDEQILKSDLDNATVVQEATCLEDEIVTYECQDPAYVDQHIFHDVIVPGTATGHSWDNGKVTTPATCTTDGVMTYTCTNPNCGATKTEPIKATGHNWSYTYEDTKWGEVLTPPSCEEGGVALAYCTNPGCDAEELRDIDALGHFWSDWEEVTDTKPTCADNGAGHYERHCEICQKVETGESYVIDADHESHVWDKWVVEKEPTCAEEGYQVHICTICHAKQYETIPALDDNYQPYSSRLIDCYTMEITERCVNCNGKTHEDYTHNVAVSAHTFDTKKVDYEQPATCTESGYKVYKCTHWDEKHTEIDFKASYPTWKSIQRAMRNGEEFDGYEIVEVKATGHTWGEWTQRIEVNQDDSGNVLGYWIRQCETCGYEQEYVDEHEPGYVAPEPVACTHENTEKVEELCTEPTCEQAGENVYKCTECGQLITETVDALEHDWNDGEVLTEVGCEINGRTLYTCERCGDYYIETTEATGHTLTEVAAVDPTYEAEGNTAGSVCEVCGWTDVETIPALETPAIVTENVEKAESGVSGTGTVSGDVAEDQMVRVAVVYENADGAQILVVNVASIRADGTFKVPSVKAPYGYTLQSVCFVVVNDDAAIDGAYADYAVGDQVVM